MWGTADALEISKRMKFLVEMENVFYFTEKPHGRFGQPGRLRRTRHGNTRACVSEAAASLTTLLPSPSAGQHAAHPQCTRFQ